MTALQSVLKTIHSNSDTRSRLSLRVAEASDEERFIIIDKEYHIQLAREVGPQIIELTPEMVSEINHIRRWVLRGYMRDGGYVMHDSGDIGVVFDVNYKARTGGSETAELQWSDGCIAYFNLHVILPDGRWTTWRLTKILGKLSREIGETAFSQFYI